MAMQKIAVLRGSLNDISLPDLVQCLSLGRQYMTVELEASGGHVLGALLVKSGMLLDASTPQERGKHAFFLLLGDSRAANFAVFRLVGSLQTPRPLGRIDSLVLESVSGEPDSAPPAPPAPALPRASDRAPSMTVPSASGFPASAAAPGPSGRIIAVCSSKGGVGKTTLVLNLGDALAERGLSVLLVDADPMGGLGDSLTHRVRQAPGVYEILTGRHALADCLIPTRLKGLTILPAGQWPPDDGEDAWRFSASAWSELLDEAARGAEVVLVDTAAGLQGVATSVMRHCDEVLGVLQAEALSARSFRGLLNFIGQFSKEGRPRLGGIVVNMFHYQQGASHHAVHDALRDLPPGIVMQPVIPRDPMLVEASSYGVPVALLKEHAPSALTGIFDSLATDLSLRLGVGRGPSRQVTTLVD